MHVTPMLILFLGMISQAAHALPVESDYYPLKLGSVWHYKVGDISYSCRVAQREMRDNEVFARLDYGVIIQGELTRVPMPLYIIVTREGVFSLQDVLPPPPRSLFLKLPLKEESWVAEQKNGDRLLRTHCSVSKEKISVLAGEFETFKVTGKLKVDGKTVSTGHAWYAKGIGLVKSESRQENGSVFSDELERFEPGK